MMEVLEHIEKEIARIIKSKDLTIDSKSLEFKELRKQFLELRLIRSKWKKELLEDSGKSVNDFRNEIYKKFDIEGEQLTPVIENYAPEPTQPYLVEKEDKPSQIDISPKLSEMKEEFISERLLSGFSPKSTRELESTID